MKINLSSFVINRNFQNEKHLSHPSKNIFNPSKKLKHCFYLKKIQFSYRNQKGNTHVPQKFIAILETPQISERNQACSR